MNRAGGRKAIDTTKQIKDSLEKKYDFITDDLLKNIKDNKLSVDDVLKILTVLQEDIYKLPNNIVSLKHADQLESIPWTVGDIIICPWNNQFVLFYYKNQRTILFKDSTGKSIPTQLRKLLPTGKQVISNLKNDGEYNHLMPIGNIEIIGKAPVNSFESYDGFIKFDDLEKFDKRIFDALQALQLTGYIDKELRTIETKTAFKSELNAYIKECLNYQRLNELSNKYNDVLVSESKKYENSGEAMDTKAIEKARKEMISEKEKMEASAKQFKPDEGKLKIEKEYPEESKHFKNIFDYLGRYQVDEKFMLGIEMISTRLNLSYDDMKKFYKLQKTIDPSKSKPTEDKSSDKDAILSKFAKTDVVNSIKKDNAILSKSSLLSEIRKRNSLFTNKDILNLDVLYDQTMKSFKDKWFNKQAVDINKWARKVRGKLQRKDMCEAMAVCIRGFQIVSKGVITLRDAQILSSLMFMSTTKGNFAEIGTGEGKTIIIATLAVIKVLEGKSVDIITSNSVLAEEGLASTREFYYLFGVHASQNNFDRTYKTGPRDCYHYDIVYGNIGNFQFDYLRDSFEDSKTRDGRKFDFLILDEVDSLTIDNGTYIAKLAQPFPGVECLRYVYIKIWVLLQKAETEYKENVYLKMKEMANDTELKRNKSDEEMQNEVDKYFVQSIQEMPDKLKKIIKDQHPLDIAMIPNHLKDYCNSMLDRWINNAIFAKYFCHEKEAYVLKKLQNQNSDKQEMLIVPVDYANTGVTLTNTMWSNGLHQFVQLKHNMRLTSESLTASYISNLSYIKLYNNNMYGMTGTLGSVAEQTFLSSIYNLNFFYVPNFKQKQFQELNGIVVEDSEWANCVIINAYLFVKQERSVLIICETISDVEVLKANLEALIEVEDAKDWIKTRYYYDDTFADLVLRDKVGPGEIIVATNIAGRGTDFKTTKELEANGGLHVCVAFLPCNERVEQQAFGRTARKGNFGTAQLILRQSDVIAIGYEINDDSTIGHIKQHRNSIEMEKLTTMRDGKVKEVLAQDELFQKFAETYRSFLKEQIDKRGGMYLTMDLKEIWAFWLRTKKFDGSEKINYKEFLDLAKATLDGKISFNPFYAIKQTEYFLKNDEKDKAKEALETALNIAKSSIYAYPAFIQQFEISVADGQAVLERFKQAVAKFAFIEISPNTQYKEDACKALDKAYEGVKAEIDYITTNLLENADFHAILVLNLDEKDKIDTKNNLLLKHISSRYYALVFFQNHIDSLRQQIRGSCGTPDGITIEGKIINYLKQLKPENDDEKFLKENILEEELADLNNVGFSTVYTVRNVYGVSDVVLRGAQIQIAAGIAIFVGCCFFPPSLAIGGPIAGALIGEGLTDIVIDLIQQGSVEFNLNDYIKSKCVNFLISVITIGFLVAAQSIKLLNVAAKTLQGIAKVLQKSPILKGVFIKAAQWLQKYAAKLLLRIQKIKIARAALKGETLTRSVAIRMGLKEIGYATGLNLAGALIGEYVISKGIAAILEASRGKIMEAVRSAVDAKFDGKLEHVSTSEVKTKADDLCRGTAGKLSWDIFKDTVVSLTQISRSWKVKLAGFTIYSVTNGIEIVIFTNQFCNELLLLVKQDNTIKNTPEVIKQLKTFLTETITNHIFKTIMALAQGAANNFIVNPLMHRLIRKHMKKFANKGRDDPMKEKSFKDIAQAYKLLGLDESATPKEIEKAYKKLALMHHPDSHKAPNADLFISISNAKDLLINLHNFESPKTTKPQSPAELPAPKDLPMAHKGNIETLSHKLGIPIDVVNTSNNKTKQFGSDYGDDALVVYYRPPEKNKPGHYFIPGSENMFIPTVKNNCLYDALSLQMKERGFKTSPLELRKQATAPSFANLKYNAINKLTSMFNNTHTAALYAKMQKYILVGGFDSDPLPLNADGQGRYPSGQIPINTSIKTKEVIQMFDAHLTQLHQQAEQVNVLRPSRKNTTITVGNLPNEKDSLPLLAYPPDKAENRKAGFMMGVLEVEFVGDPQNTNKLKLISISGLYPFKDRLEKLKPTDATSASDVIYQIGADRYKAKVMDLEIDGFKFVDPGQIDVNQVYDVYARRQVQVQDPDGKLGNKKTSCCAAVKLLSELGKHMEEHNLTIKGDIKMVEAWFESPSKGFVIENSCNRCKVLLPQITHKD